MKKKIKKDFIHVSGKKYDAMMGRCYRDTDSSYKSHGGRGIKVCYSWIEDINNFRKWLLEEIIRLGTTTEKFVEFSRTYQLDRVDPNGHYTPENCRLTDSQTNIRNQRRTKGKTIISAEGKKYVF
jgi:hypothetical protein